MVHECSKSLNQHSESFHWNYYVWFFVCLLSRPRFSCHKLPHPTPFRCVEAATIITTPSPTKAVFVTLSLPEIFEFRARWVCYAPVIPNLCLANNRNPFRQTIDKDIKGAKAWLTKSVLSSLNPNQMFDTEFKRAQNEWYLSNRPQVSYGL